MEVSTHDNLSIVDLSYLKGRLKVKGEDNLNLLDRLTTNNLTYLTKLGDGLSSVLTTNKGRIIDLLEIYFFQDYLFLINDLNAVSKVSEWIDFYTIMEDVELLDVTEETFQIRIISHNIHEIYNKVDLIEPSHFVMDLLFNKNLMLIKNSMAGLPYLDIIGDIKDFSVIFDELKQLGTSIDVDEYEKLRVSIGYPKYGNEYTEEFNPLEAQLIEHISFNKGCYIGQEVVARLNTYNKVQRTLVKLRSDKQLQLGDLRYDGKKVGIITSVYSHQGIGYVKNIYSKPGVELSYDDYTVQVYE
jgi:folate-binding protein YgfZ